MINKTIQQRQALADLNSGDAGFKQFHPVIQRVLLNRNINTQADTETDLKQLLRPEGLKGIEQAAGRIATAIEQQQSILIVGDYDADGATACAVAIRGLRAMGVAQADYKVPNRFRDGYGLSLKLAREISAFPADQRPALVITVDNGISSVDGVTHLQNAQIDVVVTDHHLPGDRVPEAYAIVNPNQLGCTFQSKAISGVGVMFYVLLAVRKVLLSRDYFTGDYSAPNLGRLLDLVALGTVADVVPLDRNNRILVASGIARMRAGHLCAGIDAILKVADSDRAYLRAQDMGFVIGPRLNASGRMDDISSGIECLLSDDPLHAEALARRLDEINRSRKDIEQSMQHRALEVVKKLDLARRGTPMNKGLVLFDDAWHEGVVGLVASRIKDKTGVPVLVFAPGEGGILKGSARSIPEVHIRDVLANIDAGNDQLIERFGGHAMAAGLSIRSDQLAPFKQAFEDEVGEALKKRPPANTLLTDGELEPQALSREFAATLQTLLPWGQGCAEPAFEGRFEVLNARFVGETHLKLVLRPLHKSGKSGDTLLNSSELSNVSPDLPPDLSSIDAICFRYIDNPDSPQKRTALELRQIRAVYRLDVNRFRGRQTLQLMLDYIEPL